MDNGIALPSSFRVFPWLIAAIKISVKRTKPKTVHKVPARSGSCTKDNNIHPAIYKSVLKNSIPAARPPDPCIKTPPPKEIMNKTENINLVFSLNKPSPDQKSIIPAAKPKQINKTKFQPGSSSKMIMLKIKPRKTI